MLRVSNLTKTFRNGDQNLIAVNNAAFSVSRGEVIIIIGPSGSGKTTLVSMLGGLSKPTSGSIKISDKEITGLNHDALAKFRLDKIGFVFQNFKLLKALTVEENVMVPLCCIGNYPHHEALKRSREVLDSLDMKDFLKYNVDKLSGGEKQRVAIARALINNPEIILADEPTASLDSKTGQVVSQILRNAAKKQNRTVIIVSHDPRILPIADRIFKVEDGNVREEIK